MLQRSQSDTIASGSPNQLPQLTNRNRRASVCGEPIGDNPPLMLDQLYRELQATADEKARSCYSSHKRELFFFDNLNGDQDELLIRSLKREYIRSGEVIFREGDYGDKVYLLEKGRVEISKINYQGEEEVVQILDGHGCFGELAVLYNKPRAATVKTMGDCTVWTIERRVFSSVVVALNARRMSNLESFLRTVPLLKHLEDDEISRIADALFSIDYSPGQTVIQEGDEADGMYFIEKGEVSVTTTMEEDEGLEKTVQLKTLGPGDHFGEAALLWKQPRMATVTAISDLTVAKLPSDSFERLMGPCQDVMEKDIEFFKLEKDRLLKQAKSS